MPGGVLLPLHTGCFAQQLSMKDGVNISSKTSEAFSGTGTVGPTDELKSLLGTEVRLVDQSAGRVGVVVAS